MKKSLLGFIMFFIALLVLIAGIVSCFKNILPGLILISVSLGISYYAFKFLRLHKEKESQKSIEQDYIENIKEFVPVEKNGKIISDESGNKFTLPKDYIVCNYLEKTTRVRGVYYQTIEKGMVENGQEVVVRHMPNEKYPEQCEISTNEVMLGFLMADMAKEFLIKYGEGFLFHGKVIKWEMRKDEKLVGSILVRFSVPEFKKTSKLKS